MKYTLPTTKDKSKYVQEKFGGIAKKYDLFNDIITLGMHRYWKRFLVKKIELEKNKKCLDLCCGTGDISNEIYKQYPESKVFGLDFSNEMLKIASTKNSNNQKIKFLCGDAMNIPFPDLRFDAVTIGYGLRNVSDIKVCLGEIYRVLNNKGILACLDLGKVRIPIISNLNNFYFFKVIPLIGNWLIPGEEMFHYLPHSSTNYPSQESIKRIMLEVGFNNVDIHNFIFGASTIHVAYKNKFSK